MCSVELWHKAVVHDTIQIQKGKLRFRSFKTSLQRTHTGTIHTVIILGLCIIIVMIIMVSLKRLSWCSLTVSTSTLAAWLVSHAGNALPATRISRPGSQYILPCSVASCKANKGLNEENNVQLWGQLHFVVPRVASGRPKGGGQHLEGQQHFRSAKEHEQFMCLLYDNAAGCYIT